MGDRIAALQEGSAMSRSVREVFLGRPPAAFIPACVDIAT